MVKTQLGSLVAAVVICACSLTGCASHAPETSDPSAKEIKTDSDRMFEKMKQEERERAKGTEATPR
jgi:outer membrane murein-binding lipoprotein Lpp